MLRLALATVIAGPLLGAIAHHSSQPERTRLGEICSSEGYGAAEPQAPALLSVLALADASALYGERTGARLFCRPKPLARHPAI